VRRWLVLVVALAACGGAAVRPTPEAPAPTMRAHFIDVGQGDATLLEFPCGAALIDTGGELNDSFDSVAALRRTLDTFFARRTDLGGTLDLLVLTHPHLDHVRGVPMILERYKVKNVIDDGLERSSGAAQVLALHDWLRHHPEVRHEDIHAERARPAGLTDDIIDPIRCPEVDPAIRVLWGQVAADPGWAPDHRGQNPFVNENNHSVVVRVDFGRASFLFPGDLEEAAIGDLVHDHEHDGLLDVDVYKVGHHGSRNGTTAAEVALMTPRIAIISAGPTSRHAEYSAWEFGHPHRLVAKLLEEGVSERHAPREVLVGERREEFTPMTLGAAIYATGWDGTIVLEATTRGEIRVLAPAPPAPAPAPTAPAPQSQRSMIDQPSWM
jgi:competence protein ComEC